jgi:hypothetical protein
MLVIGSFLSRGASTDAQIAIESNCQPNLENASLYRAGSASFHQPRFLAQVLGAQEQRDHPLRCLTAATACSLPSERD